MEIHEPSLIVGIVLGMVILAIMIALYVGIVEAQERRTEWKRQLAAESDLYPERMNPSQEWLRDQTESQNDLDLFETDVRVITGDSE